MMSGRVVYLVDTPPAEGFKMWADKPDMMDASTAAAALGVSVPTIRRLIASRTLHVVRIGRAVRIPKTALLDYIGEGCIGSVEND
jgi:excisionase family DNA binding protein